MQNPNLTLLGSCENSCLGGLWNTRGEVINQIQSGTRSGAGGLVDTTNAMGAGLIQVGKPFAPSASSPATAACKIIQSTSAQEGARMAAEVPYGYSQGVAQGVAVGTGMCYQSNPIILPQEPTQTGSLKGGFISPWATPSRFTSPWAMPNVKALYQRQYNWFDVNTADRPYLATWGLSAAAKDVPFYKKWWVWAIAGVAVLGGGGFFYMRRKRHAAAPAPRPAPAISGWRGW